MINSDCVDKKRRLRSFLFLVTGFCLLVSGFCGCSIRPYQSQTRLVMGVVVEIIAQDKKAIEAAFSEIERVATLLDNTNPESEISRLNRDGQLKASMETLAIIKAAKKMSALSNGAFDITAGSLVKLWNVKENTQKAAALVKTPPESKIKEALSVVGLNFVEIDEKSSIIRLKKKGIILDLGFFIKGYAVDRAIKTLKESGTKSALVNAGGEIYCLNRKGLFSWSIAFPGPRGKSAKSIFRLRNRAVATVGSDEQYFIYNNRRCARIIDPRTGYPVDNGVVSVTVFADDCMTAEALASAIFILGKDKGNDLAARLKNIDAKISTRQ